MEFQKNLHDWLLTGGIIEGDSVKEKLFSQITQALSPAGETKIDISDFFDQIERAIFSNDILARWRHQKSLDYLQSEVTILRSQAAEAVGKFSVEKQNLALNDYCEEALRSWDIIDLTNLPEGDVDVATQNLLVRQLYMPLRIDSQISKSSDDALRSIEQQRFRKRSWEAGHSSEKPIQEKIVSAGIGELLKKSSRLVILGDPGAGKTTLLRWLATAMLLRHKKDIALDKLPDIETLPEQEWIPVLIRCRDLGDVDLCRCFSEFLMQHLQKSTLLPQQAVVMHALIMERISLGKILVMIDGLDEITNTQVRVKFCQELERTAVRYPDASIVVTSRIVGYRDMPYRMRENFVHGVISELNREHKDLFAKRWIEVTEQRQSLDERKKREKDLIESLHASDRIERLTGNPMLLTTLALVKRKVGKLPNRRNKLYAEAVGVLLNWNPDFYATIDENEALPQLEYLAFEMCKRGIQRITDTEIMDLLEKFRQEYPSIRAVRNHTEAEFLALLEARSSILIKAGNIWKKGQKREEAAWEFRHLTFQEYLAARALIDGKYSERDKNQRLSAQVAPLAGFVREVEFKANDIPYSEGNEFKISDPWTEILRLLVIDCQDDDVDDILTSIRTPLAHELDDAIKSSRVSLAALCLADEPNVSEGVAHAILQSLADEVSDEDDFGNQFTQAGTEIIKSQWRLPFRDIVLGKFIAAPQSSFNYASYWASITSHEIQDEDTYLAIDRSILDAIKFGNDTESISASLTIMNAAYEGRLISAEEYIDPLIKLLSKNVAASESVSFAASWALGWLSKTTQNTNEKRYWQPTLVQIEIIGGILQKTDDSWDSVQFWLAWILGNSSNRASIAYFSSLFGKKNGRARRAAVEALSKVGNQSDCHMLYPMLDELDPHDRIEAARALVSLKDKRGEEEIFKLWHSSDVAPYIIDNEFLNLIEDSTDRKLLSQKLDGKYPAVQHTDVIDLNRASEAAKVLNIKLETIYSKYFSIKEKYNLKIDIV